MLKIGIDLSHANKNTFNDIITVIKNYNKTIKRQPFSCRLIYTDR